MYKMYARIGDGLISLCNRRYTIHRFPTHTGLQGWQLMDPIAINPTTLTRATHSGQVLTAWCQPRCTFWGLSLLIRVADHHQNGRSGQHAPARAFAVILVYMTLSSKVKPNGKTSCRRLCVSPWWSLAVSGTICLMILVLPPWRSQA